MSLWGANQGYSLKAVSYTHLEGRNAIMEDLLNGYFLQVLTFVCINIILAMTIYMTLCTGDVYKRQG